MHGSTLCLLNNFLISRLFSGLTRPLIFQDKIITKNAHLIPKFFFFLITFYDGQYATNTNFLNLKVGIDLQSFWSPISKASPLFPNNHSLNYVVLRGKKWGEEKKRKENEEWLKSPYHHQSLVSIYWVSYKNYFLPF